MLDKKEDGGLKTAVKALRFFVRLAAKHKPSQLVYTILYSLTKAALPFVGVLLPKLVLDELSGPKDPVRLLLYAVAAAGVSALCYLLSETLRLRVERGGILLESTLDKLLGEKTCSMDYQYLEDPESLTILQRARQGRMTRGGMYAVMVWHLPSTLTNLFTCLGMLWVVAQLDWWVLALLLLCVAANLLLLRKNSDAANAFMMHMGDFNRMFAYLYFLAFDFTNGKDIRLFHTAPMIQARMREYNGKVVEVEKESYLVMCRCGVLQALLAQAQLGVVYISLLVQVFQTGLSIGDFVMFAAAASSFATTLTATFSEATQSLMTARLIAPYRQFLRLKDRMPKAEGSVDGQAQALRFENVSFRYPRAQAPTLRNLNLTLKKGQRLAVVGENGAGKTTMIKLLLRLYDPDEGRILLGDRDIRELSPKEYAEQFSVGFQDFKLFAFSVRENICLGREEEERLRRVLAQTGLDELLAGYEKGVDTSVYKQFDEKGVEFSGGERQKIAIARALYKDAPIVVMDEPTAALDPIAEEEIYNQLNALIHGRTALFISHRLSSCKFCDEVAVFQDGRVVEQGSHEELMKEEGLYRRMFTAQSKYYV